MTQSQALAILKTGANVFLTGEPGSGKTYVINQYVTYLRDRGIEPAITASTGIAATHIGGITIHSWSGIGIKTMLNKHDLHKIATSQYIAKRVRRAKVLIIEEVSMLAPETLSMVDMVIRKITERQEPFGGVQVVFSGDFFQLPPVVKRVMEDNDTPDHNPYRIAYRNFFLIMRMLTVSMMKYLPNFRVSRGSSQCLRKARTRW
ncbi:AAA family ATPase [Candidatus Amesbacteria bacterium]|nr:AAA family ATPase [Candidatus Amesbacteria bacterium]